MKKLGLALGSGGARGLVHIGVLEVLEKHGINVSYVAGSSAGAMIGAMFCAGHSSEDIKRILLENKLEAFSCFFDPAWGGGLIAGKRLGEKLKLAVGVDKFEDLKIPLSVVAADLRSGEEKVFTEGDLILPLRGSMGVPYLLKPVEYEDNLLLDGGLVNPVPDDVVRGMGAEVVLSVNLDYRQDLEDAEYKSANMVMKRCMNIARHKLAEYSLNDSDIVLNPTMDERGFIGLKSYLDDKRANRLIEAGKLVAERHIDELKEHVNFSMG